MRADRASIEDSLLEVAGRLGLDLDADAPVSLDSLERAELAFALEEELGARLPADLLFRTTAEAAAAIADTLDGTTGRALEPGIGHLQWLAQAVINRPLRAYFRVEVTGQEHVPGAGPAVLAVNHDSLLDIPVLGLACPRYLLFMAKAELFAGGVASAFFHTMGAFPVRRGGFDLRAIRAAVEVIDEGKLLAMFPEGTRARTLGPFLAGAGWVALARGVPLVPVGITGTADAMPTGSRLPRRTRVRVRFGEPMDVGREIDPRTRLERAREVTIELRSAVEALLSD